MRRLCQHISEIYQQEIAKGNILTGVQVNYSTFLPAKHIVYFDHPLGEYPAEEMFLKKSVHKLSRFDTPSLGYLCLKCGCFIVGPLAHNQQGWYESNKAMTGLSNIIATPQNIYWDFDKPSSFIYPVQRNYDDFDMEPERHPLSMRGYYDMGTDALPAFKDSLQAFQTIATTLLDIFREEQRENHVSFMTVTSTVTVSKQWSLLFTNSTNDSPHYLKKTREMTSKEQEALQSVIQSFSTCKYGRLHYINVRNGQVSFTTFSSYSIEFLLNENQPTFTATEANSIFVEKMTDHWFQKISYS